MNVPNLPTDNLYKFIAIFGLVIFISAWYLLLKSYTESKEFITEIDIRQNEVQSILSNLNEQADELKILEQSLDTIMIYERQNLAFENSLNSDKLKSLNEELKRFDENYGLTFPFILSCIMTFIGATMIQIGLKQWYEKHQRYIDAEIKWKGETFIELLKDAEKIKIKKELNPDTKD
jgi:hypothetical protein